MNQEIKTYQNAVEIIKTAILQSQARAAKAVNQEQLALYFGIGRYVSANTRKKNWSQGAIEAISNQLKHELPGLRGFSAPSLRKMRIFYEEWSMLERNSFVPTNKLDSLPDKTFVATNKFTENFRFTHNDWNLKYTDVNIELKDKIDNITNITIKYFIIFTTIALSVCIL